MRKSILVGAVCVLGHTLFAQAYQAPGSLFLSKSTPFNSPSQISQNGRAPELSLRKSSRKLSSLQMQQRGPGEDFMANSMAQSAAIAAAAVNAAVSMRPLEAPDVDKTYIVKDAARQGIVDDEGLPIVYDKDLIGETALHPFAPREPRRNARLGLLQLLASKLSRQRQLPACLHSLLRAGTCLSRGILEEPGWRASEEMARVPWSDRAFPHQACELSLPVSSSSSEMQQRGHELLEISLTATTSTIVIFTVSHPHACSVRRSRCLSVAGWMRSRRTRRCLPGRRGLTWRSLARPTSKQVSARHYMRRICALHTCADARFASHRLLLTCKRCWPTRRAVLVVLSAGCQRC